MDQSDNVNYEALKVLYYNKNYKTHRTTKNMKGEFISKIFLNVLNKLALEGVLTVYDGSTIRVHDVDIVDGGIRIIIGTKLSSSNSVDGIKITGNASIKFVNE